MRYHNIIILLILGLILSGCAATEYAVTPAPGEGIYYTVQRGDSLWRISRYYGIGIDAIANANRLPDKKKIFAGQRLFIPTKDEQFELPSPETLEEKSFIWPVKGKVVSFFGSIEDNIKNKGIDIKAKRGAPVAASRGGVVSYVDENMKGFGKTVIIDHGDGFSTVYAYNSKILVEAGQRIAKKTVIAKAGDTGRASRPRLHFEIRKNKAPRNPFYYLP